MNESLYLSFVKTSKLKWAVSDLTAASPYDQTKYPLLWSSVFAKCAVNELKKDGFRAFIELSDTHLTAVVVVIKFKNKSDECAFMLKASGGYEIDGTEMNKLRP